MRTCGTVRRIAVDAREASGSGEVLFAAARSAGTDLAEIGDAGV
jgi:hypothetical protein